MKVFFVPNFFQATIYGNSTRAQLWWLQKEEIEIRLGLELLYTEEGKLYSYNNSETGRDRLAQIQMVKHSLCKNLYVGTQVRFSQRQDFFQMQF